MGGAEPRAGSPCQSRRSPATRDRGGTGPEADPVARPRAPRFDLPADFQVNPEAMRPIAEPASPIAAAAKSVTDTDISASAGLGIVDVFCTDGSARAGVRALGVVIAERSASKCWRTFGSAAAFGYFSCR